MNGFCFICSLPAHSFDSVPGGFQAHLKKHHNMWNYLYYTLYLEDLDPEERTFTETFLYRKFIEELDPSPFPLKKSMQLLQKAADLDTQIENIAETQARMQAAQIRIQAQLDYFISKLGGGGGGGGSLSDTSSLNSLLLESSSGSNRNPSFSAAGLRARQGTMTASDL